MSFFIFLLLLLSIAFNVAQMQQNSKMQGYFNKGRIGFIHRKYSHDYENYNIIYVVREIEKLADGKSFIEVIDIKGSTFKLRNAVNLKKNIPNIMDTKDILWKEEKEDVATMHTEDIFQRSVMNTLHSLPQESVVYEREKRKYTALDMLFELKTKSPIGIQYATDVLSSNVESVKQKALAASTVTAS